MTPHRRQNLWLLPPIQVVDLADLPLRARALRRVSKLFLQASRRADRLATQMELQARFRQPQYQMWLERNPPL